MLRGLDFCYAYIDDILVASTSREEDLHHLDIIFNRLQDYGVVVNPAKCVFGQSSVRFLGYLVSSKSTQPLPEKVVHAEGCTNPGTLARLTSRERQRKNANCMESRNRSSIS